MCVCTWMGVLYLCPIKAQMVHSPAVADGVEESTATGGAGVAAWHARGAALHQAAAATDRGCGV